MGSYEQSEKQYVAQGDAFEQTSRKYNLIQILRSEC